MPRGLTEEHPTPNWNPRWGGTNATLAVVLLTHICFGSTACERGTRQPATQPQPPSARAATTDPKERELASLPVAIDVRHAPNPVKARPGGRSGAAYTWLYTTEVRSTAGRLTLQEFGAFSWHEGRWVFNTVAGRPFTPGEFADWYSSPNAVIEPGTVYADPSNYTGGPELRAASRSKWYFIAADDSGRRVKGEAVVDELPELAD